MKKVLFPSLLKTGFQLTLLLAISVFSMGPARTNIAYASAPAATDTCGQLLTDAEAKFLASLPADGSIPVTPEVRAAAQEYIRVSKLCYEQLEAQNSSATPQTEVLTHIDDGGVLLGSESSAEYNVVLNKKWSSGTITYSFMGNGISFSAEDPNPGNSVAITSLPGFQACFLTEIQNAFAAWQAVANISFVEVTDNGVAFDASGATGDIRIGAHAFDGVYGTLAHAYFPPPNGTSAAGDLHFDSGENWTCNTSGTDIGIVVLHEIGHSLGLNHQESPPTAVMNPTYNTSLTSLQSDDISGITSIYGAAATLEAPSNDDFSTPTPVNSTPFTDSIITTGATVPTPINTDPQVTAECDGKLLYKGDKTVWYQYSPSSSKSVIVDTIGSDYDTYIAVWTGTGLSDLTLVACDDDNDTGYQSQLRLDAQGGITYFIEVAGYAGTQSNPQPNTNPGGNLEFHLGSSMPESWAGGVVVTSDRNVVAVGRPHVGDQIMTYNGNPGGSLTTYVPMLFNGAWGGSYNAAFYVQNVNSSNIASITIKYYNSDGVLNCTVTDSISPLASKGYWVPSSGCNPALPAGWVGGVVITSNQNIVAVGRLHIGSEVTSYNGFSAGSLTSYVPMLFNGAWGSYNAAFYVQNVNSSNIASITIKYYNSDGVLNCTVTDSIAPFASKGYWVPSSGCNPALPAGWVGGVVITSNQNIVAVGRPHIGSEITSYNGFSAGSLTSYVPMLFNGAWGSYNAAFYVQNVNSSNIASITIKYYDSNGVLNCTVTDSISPLASKGYWVPSSGCNPALPAGWVGGVVITSNQNIVAVGRPHIDTQIASYDGFAAGSLTTYVPMLFKNMWGSYNSAFYIQNVDSQNSATVTLRFYDTDGNLVCTRSDTIPSLASLGYWVPSVTCTS